MTLSKVNPWYIAPVVALAAFMEILDISIANVSLPHIAGDLSASQDESTWVLTSYLVTNAMIMPVSGWMSNRFGRKNFFVTCIIGFTVSSLLCGLAPNLMSLIILRAIQGAAGGGLQPSGQAILADSFPPEKRGLSTAIYGIAAVFAPAIGPTLGGWITDSYSWRWVFLINVPIGIILVFLIQLVVHETEDEKGKKGLHKVDWQGFALIGLTLGSLQIILDRGQIEDWFNSNQIITLSVLSALSCVTFFWWELRHPDPMVKLNLFRNSDFTLAFFLMLMLGFMLFGTTFLIPAFAQSLKGYTALTAGLCLTPGGLTIILLMPLIGRIISRVDTRLLLMIGLTLVGSGMVWMEGYFIEIPFIFLVLGRIIQSAGLAFLFMPLNILAFRSSEKSQINDASALVNLARNFGGSIGIAFASTLLERRTQFHQSRLAEQIQLFNPNYHDYLSHLTSQFGTIQMSMAYSYRMMVEQAAMLAYLDDFKVMAFIAFGMIPLLCLVKPSHKNKNLSISPEIH